ncbi:MAG: hypothetical protein J6K81_05915, partial [Rikenellaceae bacterium]|nr:hypothetical protein [Rikenellaceae bacterium]
THPEGGCATKYLGLGACKLVCEVPTLNILEKHLPVLRIIKSSRPNLIFRETKFLFPAVCAPFFGSF